MLLYVVFGTLPGGGATTFNGAAPCISTLIISENPGKYGLCSRNLPKALKYICMLFLEEKTASESCYCQLGFELAK